MDLKRNINPQKKHRAYCILDRTHEIISKESNKSFNSTWVSLAARDYALTARKYLTLGKYLVFYFA